MADWYQGFEQTGLSTAFFYTKHVDVVRVRVIAYFSDSLNSPAFLKVLSPALSALLPEELGLNVFPLCNVPLIVCPHPNADFTKTPVTVDPLLLGGQPVHSAGLFVVGRGVGQSGLPFLSPLIVIGLWFFCVTMT